MMETTAESSESTANAFERTFDTMRNATESALKMQQEMYGQWSKMWPGFASPQSDWTANFQRFQKEWTGKVTELMQKHRETLHQQYLVGIESIEQAFLVAESKDPDELRQRCESLCRKTMDLMKATSETQMQQFQETMNKWIELCQTKP